LEEEIVCPWCKDKPVKIRTPFGLKMHVERCHPDISKKAPEQMLKVLEERRKAERLKKIRKKLERKLRGK